MNSLKKFFVLSIVILFLSIFVSSQQEPSSISLTLNNSSFVPGDTIEVTALVHNSSELNQHFTLTAVLDSVIPGFEPHVIIEEIDLVAGEEETIELYAIKVKEDFPQGDYFVSAELKAGLINSGNDSANFFVKDTLEEFSLDATLCKDSDCKEKTKTFILGDEIYLLISTNQGNVSLDIELTTPSGKKNFSSSKISFTANEVGLYSAIIKAELNGYADESLIENFSVIKKEANFDEVSQCNRNGVCDFGENQQLCPQDCTGSLIESGFDFVLALLAIIVIILLIAGFVFMKKKEPIIPEKKEDKEVDQVMGNLRENLK